MLKEHARGTRLLANVVGSICLAYGLWLLWQFALAQGWPKTEGTILKFEKLVCRSGSKPTVELSLRYGYRVDGRLYEASRYDISGFRAYPLPEPGEADPIGDLVRTHPVGGIVPVFYNPGDPGSACLDRQSPANAWKILGVGAVFLVLGAATGRLED